MIKSIAVLYSVLLFVRIADSIAFAPAKILLSKPWLEFERSLELIASPVGSKGINKQMMDPKQHDHVPNKRMKQSKMMRKKVEDDCNGFLRKSPAVLNHMEAGGITRLLQTFSAKLVLEVFGGAGAIWGFSEVIGLRRPETIWFWRPFALTFGMIFFVRWIMQIQDYIIVETRTTKSIDDTFY